VLYKVTWPSNSPLTKLSSSDKGVKVEDDSTKDDTEALLRHYFNLEPNLTELYERWSMADPNFKKRAPKFTGVRILKQDAWEALVGFICSSNNNIARISQMVRETLYISRVSRGLSNISIPRLTTYV
jgi:N-glycosylase/DNA lyase